MPPARGGGMEINMKKVEEMKQKEVLAGGTIVVRCGWEGCDWYTTKSYWLGISCAVANWLAQQELRNHQYAHCELA